MKIYSCLLNFRRGVIVFGLKPLTQDLIVGCYSGIKSLYINMYRAHVDLHTSENKFLHGRHGCVWPAVTDLYNTELSSVRFRSTIERSSRVWPAEFDLLNTVNSGSWTCAHSSRLHCREETSWHTGLLQSLMPFRCIHSTHALQLH